MRSLSITLAALLILLAIFTGYNHHRHTTEIAALQAKRTEVSDKLTQTEALLKICEREIETGRALHPRD